MTESLDEKYQEKNKEIPLIVVDEVINQQDEEEPPPYTEQENPTSYIDTNEFSIKKDQEEEEEDQIEKENEDEDDNLLIGVTLTPLEKLLKFSNSTLVLQKLVITRDLSSIIQLITLEEAVNIALPIIIQLGKDPEDSVREALATELDKITYFYYENAPPILESVKTTDTFHIPKHTFAATIIEFLLDQNTTLASIAQQSVVTVAAELAETSKESDKYKLHQALLHEEIFEGIVCGLMDIFSEKQEENNEIIDSYKEDKESKRTDEKGANSRSKSYDNSGINLAKMVCLMLISALAPVFGPEGCKEKMLPIVESMTNDPMFYVRKEAATAVGRLSAVLAPEVTLERLLPFYLKLSVDTIWHVRRSCVFALPLLCEVLPNEMRTTIAVEGVELFKNDVSRNVRNSLADIAGELISKFLPADWKTTGQAGQVPEPLLSFFLSLGEAPAHSGPNQIFKVDTERIHNCAYNFPAVVLTAGVSYWDSHLKDTYLNLTKDYQLKVRCTFAYSLHEIARIIGPDRTERDLVQIFALYLMDLDDVKQGVLEHLSEFLSVLAIASRNEYIPILAEVWDGVMSNWHLRDILANQLREIARLFDASRVVEHILPLALRACHDEFAAVRESGVEIFPVILDIVKRTVDEDGENLSQVELEGAESEEPEDVFERQQKFALALLNHVMEKLDELVKSVSYRTRLVFAQICRSLLEAGINPADFASFFLPRLAMLAKDPIVNIRIATSKTIRVLCSIVGYRQDLESILFSEEGEEELNPSQILDDIVYSLFTDPDQDVQYFIQDCITPEDKVRYQQKKQTHEEQSAEPNEKGTLAPLLPAHLIQPETFPDSPMDMDSPMDTDSPIDNDLVAIEKPVETKEITKDEVMTDTVTEALGIQPKEFTIQPKDESMIDPVSPKDETMIDQKSLPSPKDETMTDQKPFPSPKDEAMSDTKITSPKDETMMDEKEKIITMTETDLKVIQPSV